MRVNTSFATSIAFVTALLVAGPALSKEDVPETIEGTTRVSAEEAVVLIGDTPNLVIIDARASADRESMGHIEDSISLPDTETTPESLAGVIPTKNTPVIFYCNGVKCGRSVTSSKLAVKEGYTKVYWFRGGWQEWVEKGMPVAH